MTEDEFFRLLQETQRKNAESMEKITKYTQSINRRIKRIFGAL